MRAHPMKTVAAALLIAAAAAMPALAIDAQAGGRGDAVATIGEAIKDQFDKELDRCECMGGPLEEIEVRDAAGEWTTIAREDFADAVVTTNDGVVIGTVAGLTNTSDDRAIVIQVAVDGDVLGGAERINVRRTGFHWVDGPVIDATLDELIEAIATAQAGV